MKHSLKISSFIIFAATVASTFTSCGNESELFDDPVMYQTRAMTRANMRSEPLNSEVLRAGKETFHEELIKNQLYLNITLEWWADSTVSGGECVSADAKPEYRNPSFFDVDYYPVEEEAKIHDKRAYATFYVVEAYKNGLPYGTIDTIKIEKRVEVDAEVFYDTKYYGQRLNSPNDSLQQKQKNQQTL